MEKRLPRESKAWEEAEVLEIGFLIALGFWKAVNLLPFQHTCSCSSKATRSKVALW